MGEITPRDETDLAEAVASAAGRGQKLRVRGGGTRMPEGRGNGAETLSTNALTGITLYDPGALTLVARAGTPLAEIEAALAQEGQHLAFEPGTPPAPAGHNSASTIGGMAAMNASGPRRLQAGACRDAMLGVRFVDGTGAIVKNGGRVMKNVTGLDLVKLMAGSRGTLGVLTEVALKVQPRPETCVSVVLDGLDLAAASKAMVAAMNSPFDVTGAAHLPEGPPGGGEGAPVTALRLEGFEGSVAYRAKRLSEALADLGPARLIEGAGPWPELRDQGGLPGGEGCLWRISVKPTDGPKLAAGLGPEVRVALDWAGGLVWALAPEELDLRARMRDFAGHATLVRGSPEAFARRGALHPEPAPVARLTAGLRARFDPHGIFDPDRMAAAEPA